MSILSSIEAGLGHVFSSGTQTTDSSGNVYSFSQQEQDIIRAQFKLALLSKQALAAGTITQAVYDQNIAAATSQIESPYVGWSQEFAAAVQSEDLQWLAKQTGQTVDSLTQFMGNALSSVASRVGAVVGTAISSTSTGLLGGFFGSLNPVGWLVVIGLGAGLVYGVKKGYVQKALGLPPILTF